MKTLFKNAFFKSLLQICNIVLPVIIGMVVLRILDRSLVDEYNAVDSYFQFFLIVGAFGVYNYGVREASRVKDDPEKSNQLFTQLFCFSGITNVLALLAYVAFAFIMYSGSSGMETKLLLSFVIIVQFGGNFFNVEWLNEADENYAFISIKSIIVRILYLLGAILFVKGPGDILIYVGVLSASAALNMIISFFYIKRKYKFDFRNFSTLGKRIMPIIAMFVIANVMLLYSQANKIVLSTMARDGTLAESEVTAYTISQHISYMIYSVIISITAISIPRLSKMIGNGKKEEAFKLHSDLSNIMFLLLIPAMVGVALLAPQIVVLYGGDKYVDAQVSLTVFAICDILCAIHYAYGEGLVYILGKDKQLLVHNVIGAACNLLPAIILAVCGVYNSVIGIVVLMFAYLVLVILDIVYLRKKCGYTYSPLNKHTILYICASALFIPIILLPRDWFYRVCGNYADIIFAGVMILICIPLYFGIVLLIELKVFKNKTLKLKIDHFVSKFKRKKAVKQNDNNDAK